MPCCFSLSLKSWRSGCVYDDLYSHKFQNLINFNEIQFWTIRRKKTVSSNANFGPWSNKNCSDVIVLHLVAGIPHGKYIIYLWRDWSKIDDFLRDSIIHDFMFNFGNSSMAQYNFIENSAFKNDLTKKEVDLEMKHIKFSTFWNPWGLYFLEKLFFVILCK